MSRFWLEVKQNYFFLFCLFLLAFIPLYPKLPLFDALPGYIVKVRLEDFLVLGAGILWLREIRLKRVVWNTSYFWWVTAYAAVGLLSITLGVLLTKTIPFELLHIGKSALTLLRYLEYFSLFFFMFSALKTKKQMGIVAVVLTLTLLGVVAYGLGQQFLHFPVYSTMNREYSKGETLYLEQGARPQSTFAGHYDLAAYLVIVLPLLFALGLSQFSKDKIRSLYGLLLLGSVGVGTVMLILTQSKTSIVGFGLGMFAVLFIFWLKLRSKQLRLISAAIFVLICFVSGIVGWRLAPQSIKNKIEGYVGAGPSGQRPTDLVGDGYEDKVIDVPQPDGTVKKVTTRVKSTWSANALKYGLSMGIRLDTLWPNALLGFSRDPLSGSGYGTLAMLDSNLFQEADSTDNNYLRTLGETGILGFVSFYGFLVFLLFQTLLDLRHGSDPWEIGFIGAILGLAISAIYLDVFAASKVAFVFWAITGAIFKFRQLDRKPVKDLNLAAKRILLKLAAVWPLLIALFLAFFLWHQDPFMYHNPTKDIEWNTMGLAEITAARCFLTRGTFSLCREGALNLPSGFNLYSFLLTGFMRMTSNLGVFYYLNILILFFSLILTYIALRRFTRPVIFGGLLIYVSLTSVISYSGVPWSELQLLSAALIFPVAAFGLSWLLQKIKKPDMRKVIMAGVGLLALAVIIRSVISGDLKMRFQLVAKNYAETAVMEANGIVDSKPGKPAYLATVLNPYFLDMYTIGKYLSLPLSSAQPYFEVKDKVWGLPKSLDIPQLYTSLLSSGANVYVSDFGLNHEPEFSRDFNSIKRDFDLRYIHLGCDENCNLYHLLKAQPIVSSDLSTPYNGVVLSAQTFPLAYNFLVVPNRFDDKLSSAPRRTTDFIEQLRAVPIKQQQFMVVSGDVGEKPEGVFTLQFMNGFADPAKIPILYSQGNMDLIPKKDVSGGYQEFFTDREYFILMDLPADSKFTEAQQLKFYNSLLKLEKLPRIQTLFIISHDLNWQGKVAADNAVNVIRRKLLSFPYIKKYVLTADHSPTLMSDFLWYVSQEDPTHNLTFAAALSAGSKSDAYFQVGVGEDGKVSLRGVGFTN